MSTNKLIKWIIAKVSLGNLAHWIAAHGGSACYMEKGGSFVVPQVSRIYGLEPEGEHYPFDGVDYYMTDALDGEYNFVVMDYGQLPASIPSGFREAEVRVLCCSALPYELEAMRDAVLRCDEEGVEVALLGMYLPEDWQGSLRRTLGREIHFAQPSRLLGDSRVNGGFYRLLLEEYMEGER